MQCPPATYPVDGAALRALRMRSGIEIPQLARQAGITASYLSRIEVGTRNRMRPATYGRLRSALGLPSDDTHDSSTPAPEKGSVLITRIDPQARSTGKAAECELVSLARQGDTEAFGALYGAYRCQVYAYIRQRVRNAAVAEDFTSETFLRAMCRIDSFTWQGRAFGAWLVVIARNLVTDHYRSSRVRREVTAGEVCEGGTYEPAPEDEVLEEHANAALWAAVGELTSAQRDCVTLRFRCGMSVAETAQLLGKREGAVKTLTHRALRSLERSLTAGQWAVTA